MKDKIRLFFSRLNDGLIAGMMISIGGAAYLACENKYVGSVLFCVALFCICIKSYSLYTGKIGYLLSKHSKGDIATMLIGLIGNVIATVAIGYLIAAAIPNIATGAETVCQAKLTQQLWQTFVRAVLCGVLVYLAVDIFRENKSPLGILLCIPAFIVSGFEHSIADIFYFSAYGKAGLSGVWFILTVLVGNSIGALIIPLLKLPSKTDK